MQSLETYLYENEGKETNQTSVLFLVSPQAQKDALNYIPCKSDTGEDTKVYDWQSLIALKPVC